jgi:hypothetical protein
VEKPSHPSALEGNAAQQNAPQCTGQKPEAKPPHTAGQQKTAQTATKLYPIEVQEKHAAPNALHRSP